jgi:tripartite-type tricarboxylate transporter receptor subunit TctC
MKLRKGIFHGAAALVAATIATHASAQADDVAGFYKGKRISVYIGSSPGGGYDTYSRLIIRHFGKYIPGKPEMLPRNMPGASSRRAAAYLYNVASKDGLSLGVVNQELPLAQALGEKMNFNTLKFEWIGSPDYDVRVVTTWHTSGVKTIEDAKRKSITMGATGPVSASGYPEMLNTLFGTKFRSVRGYKGGAAVNLAMERGEVHGRADNAWSSWQGDHADWIRDKKIHIIVQVGLERSPDLPDVPLLMDLAKDPDLREVLKLISTSGSMGHPVIAPPGVPKERVIALRRAFDATMKDAAFLKDAKAVGRPIRPVTGERLEKIAGDVLAAPQHIKDRAKTLAPVKKRKKKKKKKN